MQCAILDGKKLAKKIETQIKTTITSQKITPGLAIIQIGNDPASKVYTQMKSKACQRVGMYSKNYCFPENSPEEDILTLIQELNSNTDIHGILIQLPLPQEYNEEQILNAVEPNKDVDGFSQLNTSRLMSRNRLQPLFVPATPLGILTLLEEYKIDLLGKHVVVIGHSNIVGMPLAHLMLQKWATVTICHVKTSGLQEICLQADILISATGKARLITPDYIKSGAVVVDVGIIKEEYLNEKGEQKTRIVGDVCPKVAHRASFLTPVPGGVGPMTIAMLLDNTLKASTGLSYTPQN
jgi:methylenetetrahydrofolate dehydrogenase (NADP+) / methenyltetrahydrofolate cyclohydrolase